MADRLVPIDTAQSSGNQFPDLVQDEIEAVVVREIPDAVTDYIAEQAITFTDEGDGEGYFSVLGVPVSGTLVPPAATWSGVAGKPETYYTKVHGVTSDGTTNDVTALNTLITTVSTAGGGIVLLPPGVTRVNGSIVMKSNVTLKGHGPETVITAGASFGTGVIQIGGAISNVGIEDLKVDGNRASYSSSDSIGIYGIAPGGYSDVTVRNVWVTGTKYSGILFLGDSTRAETTERINILDCKVTDVGGHGIIGQNGVDSCRIERCRVIGHGIVASDTPGITNGRGAYDTHMIGNYVDSTGATGSSPHGISIDTPLSGFVCSGNTVVNGVGYGLEVGFATDGSVTDNHIYGGARQGILISGNQTASNTCLGVTIANNTVDGATGGITCLMGGTTSAQDIPPSRTVIRNTAYTAATTMRAIDGRRIYECTTSGTTHASVKPAGWGTTATGETVTDGTSIWTDRGSYYAQLAITGNVIRSATTGSGIDLNYVVNGIVADNLVTGCALSGIYIAANCNMLTVTGNRLQGNNTSHNAAHAGFKQIAYNGNTHVVNYADNIIVNSGLVDKSVTSSTTGLRLDDRFPDGATTPTVAHGSSFTTNNTGSTTITGFVDHNAPDSGRTITVRIADANTTFSHSSSGAGSLRLRGGVNYSPAAASAIQFSYMPGFAQWVEVGRADAVTSPTWVTAPAANNSAGEVGQIAIDTSYFYYCYASSAWRRIAITGGTWP